jgi:Protein of unknown function (DUF3631)
MKLGKSDPLKILQAVRAGVVALMKFDLEPGFNAAIAHLRDMARDLYELPVKDIQLQIDGGIQEVLEQRAVGDDLGRARKGKAPPGGKGDRVDDDQPLPLSDAEADAEIRRLASLSKIQYERQRDAAVKLLGLRAGVVDKLVKVERDKTAGDGKQGRPVNLQDPEPWPEPIDGAALLDELMVVISQHVVMSDHAVHTCALWTIHTYLLEATAITPRLAIGAPEKGCGKTTLLDVLSHLVRRPMPTAHATPSAIFRLVEMERPTLLMDEADTYLPDNNDMRNLLNAGHRRGMRTLVNVSIGDDHVPRWFETFAAVAIAGIGKLPDTLDDRSVKIELRRRRPDEPITELRYGRTTHLDELARKIVRWSCDNAERIRAIDPAMPPGVLNRAADNWRPLIMIAEAVGGVWPEAARQACAAAVAGTDDQSVRMLLLADIKAIFAEKGIDRMTSADLVDALAALEGHPWAEWRAGKAITATGMARLLKPFGISPVERAYQLFQFDDAFQRYLPKSGN